MSLRRFLVIGLAAATAVAVTMTVLAAQETAAPPAKSERAQSIDRQHQPVPVPEPSEKALRYYRSGNVLWAVGVLWGFAVPLLILFTGLSARMRDVSQRIGRKWFFALAIYLTLYSLLTFVLDLPLSWYSGFVRQHAYGLSNQTVAKFVSDMVKGLVVGLVLTPLVMWLPFLLLKKSPKRWWLYSGLASIPFIVLMLFVTPIWIEPLFNKFGPMKDKVLEQKILQLADRAGIHGSDVFEVNKSVDTKTVNAYVTGFMNTKRIVLWDTIIQKLDQDELLFVMGHEMGHYVLKHVAQVILFAAIVVIIGLLAVHLSAMAMIRRWGARFGFTQLSDIAAFPLIVLLFGLATFVLTPALLAMSRHNEHEADRFGLEITRSNRAAATAFVKLQEENLGIPRPGLLYKLWRGSHPPIGERIDFFNSYRPWETGEPMKYDHLFRERAATPAQ